MRATGKFVAAAAVWLVMVESTGAVDAVWAVTPSSEDFSAAFPRDGDRLVEGMAQLRCAVAPDRRLTNCSILSETPQGFGVGAAALKLTPKFEVTTKAAAQLSSMPMILPIRFKEAAPIPPARLALFKASKAYSGLGDAGPYYPERAARRGVTGVVLLDCRVKTGGRLDDCAPAAVSPSDYGFEYAALKMAEQGWMTAGPPVEPVSEQADGVWRFRIEFSGSRSRR